MLSISAAWACEYRGTLLIACCGTSTGQAPFNAMNGCRPFTPGIPYNRCWLGNRKRRILFSDNTYRAFRKVMSEHCIGCTGEKGDIQYRALSGEGFERKRVFPVFWKERKR